MKQYLPLIARIVVSLLFIVSAVSKMFPLWMFEKQIIDLGFADWQTAPYFARFIIGLELAIGIGIMQKHFLRTLVIPVTVLLLVAFCIHLSYEISLHGTEGGNCGCFGQLIPMTPLEALIKNILTIGIIAYIFVTTKQHEKGKNKFLIPFGIVVLSMLFMLVAFPVSSGTTEDDSTQEVVIEDQANPVDSTGTAVISGDTLNTNGTTAPAENPGPAAVKSKFAEFKNIGGKAVNLDEGKKIVCMFAPGCEHCQATATEIAQIAKSMAVPDVYILFMDEEVERIPDFLSTSKLKAKHKVLDIPKFWTLMGNDDTPAVFYLWNGNIQYSCQGTAENAFDATKFKAALKK
ncbi:MAG: MauE/DoxX family redox-associated membrane protein [Flavobacteriales bacterium]